MYNQVWMVHFWLLLAVASTIAALWLLTGKRSLKYWFLSDIVALSSLTLFYNDPENRSIIHLIAFPLFSWLMIYLRLVAVAQQEFVQSIQRYAFGCAAGLIAIRLAIYPNVDSPSLLAANSFLFSILAIMMLVAILRNKEWGVTFGSILVMLSTFIYVLVSLFRGVSMIYGPTGIFMNTQTIYLSGSTGIIVTAVAAHLGFIIMVFEQMHRSQMLSVAQVAREAEGREQAEKRELEVQRVSEEQKALIEVLTHEVRQPLNNASAALESITHELSNDRAPRQLAAVLRAQSVIDNVSTALSNALVAATILERQQKFYPARCEPVSIAEIVALDFNKPDFERLKIQAAHAPLFITADPVLMRIALRNLFDNALRYGPEGSDVLIEICEDETRMGVAFNVSNDEPYPKWTEGIDIFARRVRGTNQMSNGAGMGLYITSEIARLHNGSLTTHYHDGRRVFSLFLSE